MGAVEALSQQTKEIKRLYRTTVEWVQRRDSTAAPRTRKLRTARQLPSAEIDRLVIDYQAGATVYELAKSYGISRGIVGKHLRSRGIDTKPPGLHPDNVPAAAELYQSVGWSLARIAEKFETTANTVRLRLLELGVVMRDEHGRSR